MPLPRQDFKFSKWYFDAMDHRGRGMVGYMAEAQWGKMKLGYEGFTPIGDFGKESGRFSFPREPRQTADAIEYSFRHGSGMWTGSASSIRCALLEKEYGAIHWTCLHPAARVNVNFKDDVLSGLGYAEKIELSLWPNKIPIQKLFWGRFVSEKHSVVWIRWDGPETRLLVYYDGVIQGHCKVESDAVYFNGKYIFLPKSGFRVGTVRHNVFSGFKKIAAMIPSPALALHEKKWAGYAELHDADEIVDRGNVIHELVTWP